MARDDRYGQDDLEREVKAASLLSAHDVHKSYGGIHALRGASFDLGAGEVHGLVGENGSGKSTLLRLLSGQLTAERGELCLCGTPVYFQRPADALAAGIAIVTQETTLVPELSVAENILLGRRLVRGRLGVDWRATQRRAREVLARLELDVDLRAPVANLRTDQQQLVEVARALSMDARVLILDEPTSSLTDDEVDALFATLRRLKHDGVATIFVSHRMSEVFAVTDRLTVLRDGRTVLTTPTAAMDHDTLVEAMVGHKPQAFVSASVAGEARHALLSLRDICIPGRVVNASLDVAAGEIVGLAGLVGAGRTELLEAAFGVHPIASGAITVDGESLTTGGVQAAIRAGVAYVPADRKEQGLVLGMSVRANLMMTRTSMLSRWKAPSSTENEQCRQLVNDLRIRPTSVRASVGTLSGGNQQKVVLGKWLARSPKVLLLNEPTRGVDVAAKDEIYRLLDRARDAGMALLMSSSEVPELMLLCDRILVMFRGRVTASLSRAAASEALIASYGMGSN